jgi:flavorubredoxin
VAAIETGHRKLHEEIRDAVRKVIDPRRLRSVVVPHFEADECGGLNHFLDAAR